MPEPVSIVDWLQGLHPVTKILLVLLVARSLEPTVSKAQGLVDRALQLSKGSRDRIGAAWGLLSRRTAAAVAPISRSEGESAFKLGLIAEATLVLPTMGLSAVLFYLGFFPILPEAFPEELARYFPKTGLLGLVATPPGAVGVAFALVEAIAGARLIEDPTNAQSYTMGAIRRRPVALSSIVVLSLGGAALAAARTYYYLVFPDDGPATDAIVGSTFQILGTVVVGGLTTIVPWVLALAASAARVILDTVGAVLRGLFRWSLMAGQFGTEVALHSSAIAGTSLFAAVCAAYAFLIHCLVRVWRAPTELLGEAIQRIIHFWRGPDDDE